MDLKAVDDYIKDIKQSVDKLNEVILSKPDNVYLERVNFAVNQIGTELQFKSSEFATKSIPKAFEQGEQETNNNLNVDAGVRGDNVREVFAENAVAVNKGVYALNAFSELSKAAKLVTDNVLSVVNGVIQANPSIRMFDLQKTLQAELEREALATGTPFNVTYANGNKVAFDSYAKMVARSSMLESANVGMFSRAEALGNDLVKCTEYGSTCPICSKYEGRVYSISGKSTKYPPLYGTALKRGYSLIHPNCRHEFIPFKEDFYTNEELNGLQKKSSEPFKDDRTEKQRQLYARGQRYNKQLLSEAKEYDKFKSYYKSIGGFRKSSRANSDYYKNIKLPFKSAQNFKDNAREQTVIYKKTMADIKKAEREKEIAALKIVLENKIQVTVLRGKESRKYVGLDKKGFPILVDTKEQATYSKTQLKWMRKALDGNVDEETITISKELPYTEKIGIERKIEALENGFDDYKDYIENEEKSAIQKFNENLEKAKNGFLQSQTKQELFYDRQIEKTDKELTIPYTGIAKALTNYIKKEFKAEVVHTSSKSSESKFASSIYLKVGNGEIRISDHLIPQTGRRTESDYMTRWDDELVLEEHDKNRIIKMNKQELDEFIKELFQIS